MTKYKYRLQKLLDIREDEENKSVLDLVKCQSEKTNLENELACLNNKFCETKEMCCDNNIFIFKIKNQYLDSLAVSINNTVKKIDIKDEEIIIKKQDVHKKHMDKRTLEILKANDYNTYVKEINIKEQRELDEFGLFAYTRNIERG